ncbi:MAG TPA: DMT family transporter [Thermoleophilaceae bacterium]|nr:DMT family transporter [Thermoleophilaceae bacterium]
MLAIALALGSSACYGISNFIGPQLARRHAVVSVLVISQVAALIGCAAYLAGDGGAALPASSLLLALLAGAGNAFGLIGFYRAAELGPLSVAAPIGAVGAVVPVVWGLAGGDTLKPTQAVGVVLAMGGAALAASAEPSHPDSERSYTDPRASVVWAAVAAVAFGVFLTALPAASEDGRAWALFDARVALLALLALWAGRRLGSVRATRDMPLLAVPGLLLVAGTVLYTVAADHGQLSIVSVAGSLFPVFTVGLGVALLGERLTRLQTLGVAAAMSGVVLIAV